MGGTSVRTDSVGTTVVLPYILGRNPWGTSVGTATVYLYIVHEKIQGARA